jgi:hypothetical protein
MKKRSLIFSVVVVLILGFAIFGFAQHGSHSSAAELGYYDRATGAFTPLAQQTGPETELPPIAPTTGTLIFKFTITAKSPLPKNSVIACSGGAFVSESSGFSSTEKVTGIATLVSGTTYTCTSTINYSWLLSSPSTDKIQFQNIHASSSYGYQVTATNGTAILVQPVGGRESDQSPLAPISVPANGATTTENVSITL